MKDRIIDILTNMSDQAYGRDIILPRREAEIIAEKLVNAIGDIAYVCDEKACEGCGDTHRDCYYTTDIRHAKNFVGLPGGKFIENYVIPKLTIKKEVDSDV